MTQTTQPLLTPGTIDLAERVFEKGYHAIGIRAIDISNEVGTLVQLGVVRANERDIILCQGGQGSFEEVLRQNSETAK